jgi:hypothetical protein
MAVKVLPPEGIFGEAEESTNKLTGNKGNSKFKKCISSASIRLGAGVRVRGSVLGERYAYIPNPHTLYPIPYTLYRAQMIILIAFFQK